jgi:hypothetical protein
LTVSFDRAPQIKPTTVKVRLISGIVEKFSSATAC